jgi:hypothetical protein
MTPVARTRWPTGIDKGVVQVLLDLLDDLVSHVRRLVELKHIGGEPHDFRVVFVPDGGCDIASK